MPIKELMNKGIIVSTTLLVLLLSLTAPAVAAQVQDPGISDNVVLGENPLVRELGPPLRPSMLQPLTPQALEVPAGYRLRVVYMIPGNRTAQTGAEETLQRFVVRMQGWFRDQMERLGYGPKTFAYQTGEDGLAPEIDYLYVEEPDSYFHSDYLGIWNAVLNRISAAGFPVWQQGVMTLVIAEIHVQEPDGRIREGTSFVGGAGTNFSGVGMVTGDFLARLSEALLTDDRPYDGLVIPAIGPYPLVQDVSFPGFEGTTVSSTSSSAQGAVFHELSHGFGLWHEFRNDRNFKGNLMGNGLRGWRGALFPELYPNDDTYLSTASALLLANSRFFNAGQTFTDNGIPSVYFLTAKAQQQGGLCGIDYWAYDPGLNPSVLGGVLLIRAGQVVADIALSVSEVAGTMFTYDYTPGVYDEWNLLVTDQQGNRYVSPSARIACELGHNRAPQPHVEITTTKVEAGKDILLDASGTTDPDGSWMSLKVRWDVDGDGIFDTVATTVKSHTTTYSEPGVYRVIAELTDEIGDASISMPIGIRVVERPDVRVKIDIKPGEENTINPRAKGGIWVAVLSGDGFDPLQIDVSSVRFGPGEAAAIRYETWDFNGDGAGDLALRFSIPDAAIQCGDAEAMLAGRTIDGQSLAATDSIRTVGCQKKAAR